MRRRGNRLTPGELAEAAVLADLAVLVVVLARLTPFAGLTTVLGAVPFAVLSMRNRARVVAIAFAVGVILTFLLAGFNASTQVLVMATFGGVVGRGFRGGWGRVRTMAAALVVGWTTVSALTVGYLWVFAGIRELNLEALRVSWVGMFRALRAAFRFLGFDQSLLDATEPWVDWFVDDWYVAIPIMQGIFSVIVTLLVIRLGRPVVHRVQKAFGNRPAPSSVLVELAEQLDVPGSGLTLVAGPNGVGKSTLLRAMVDRRDDLGLLGGTAVVGQRPESQVVGVRVADDLSWGLPTPLSTDAADQALAGVGLDGFADRETSSLSGGELQRLALAAARVREPSLLLSDESTSMLDPEGRRIVMETMSAMADEGTTVIHVSHVEGEQTHANRLVTLGNASDTSRASTTATLGENPYHRCQAPVVLGGGFRGRDAISANAQRGVLGPTRPVTVVLDGVGQVHGAGTPWGRRALEGVVLGLRPGDRVLVVGTNGSGKSTLAWILAGLIPPTEGTATLDGRPLVDVADHVGLLLQYTRLQLLRPTVGEEAAAFSPDPIASSDALNRMGFGRADLTRRVDDLSIGQQRRLGLAAQLARQVNLLVLDEPMAGLDRQARQSLVEAVAELDPLTIVVTVTHDLADSRPLGDRVIRLHGGRLVADGRAPT